MKKRKHRRILFIVTGIISCLVLFALSKILGYDEKGAHKVSMPVPHHALPADLKPCSCFRGTMEYVYNSPESGNDTRYEYQWEILRTALEKTRPEYGSYRMRKAKYMTEKRQFFELKNNTGEITVMYLGTNQELEKSLFPVHIPVDRDLGGYCIMLIRKEDQEKFNRVKTLADFQKLSIGLGYGWIDADILRANHFNVVTGSTYEGLFSMLANKRFDAFSRSAVEILDEYDHRKKELKNIKIEDSLLLYYPLPMYFWFSRTPQGKQLAERVREGMEIMIKDGTYDKIFTRYQGYKTEKLNLKHRRFFRIKNPFLVPETPFGDKRLWYNPVYK